MTVSYTHPVKFQKERYAGLSHPQRSFVAAPINNRQLHASGKCPTTVAGAVASHRLTMSRSSYQQRIVSIRNCG
jgi:hypothetical protein